MASLQSALLAVLVTHAAGVAPPGRLVVLGPGSVHVQLIVAKLAAKAGYRVTHFARQGSETRSEKLMFGAAWPDIPESERPRLAVTNSQMGSALRTADAIVLCAEGGGKTDIANTLNFAPAVRKVVLLSSIGGSEGKRGGYPYGEPAAILRCEETVQAAADTQAADVSIVRVGVLKGGAASASAAPPGASEEADDPAGVGGGVGLDAQFLYDTVYRVGGYPTPDRAVAIEYDASVLGVAVSCGDHVTPRSAVQRSGTRTSTTPLDDECSRIVAAGALLAALRHPESLDFSLSARAATVPPSAEEWDRMLDAAWAERHQCCQ